MRFTDKQKKWVIITGVILVVAVGGFFAVKALMPKDTTDNAVKYSTAKVKRGDIKVGVDAVGNLSSSGDGSIAVPWSEDTSSMSYKIQDVYVKSGDQVKAGQSLVKLSAPTLASQLSDLNEQISNERKSLANLLNLPIDEVDNADPSNGIIVTAPFAGRIVGLTAKAGTKIEDLTDSIRVVDNSVVKITANLTAYEVAQIKSGKTKAIVSLSQYLGDTLAATITDINRNANPVASDTLYYENGTKSAETGNEFIYNVTLELPNPGLITASSTTLADVAFYEPKDGYKFKNGDTPAGARWCRYSAIVDSYANEEDVSSGLTGKITKIIAKNGAKVKAGDPIFAMAGTDVKEDIEKRQDSIRTKKAQLASYEMQASNLLITAPCDGMVSSLQKKQGDSTTPGEYIGSIFNPSNMSMFVNVDDTEVLLVAQGAVVTVTVDALPDKKFKGVVNQVSGTGTDTNGVSQYQVYITLTGSSDLREGMQAQAYISAGSAKNVLLVPQEAVYTEDGADKVDVLNADGTVSTVTIKVGLSNSTQVEVKSGLKEGQLVVTGSTADALPSDSTATPGSTSSDSSKDSTDKGDKGDSTTDGGTKATDTPATNVTPESGTSSAVPLGEINKFRFGLSYKENVA